MLRLFASTLDVPRRLAWPQPYVPYVSDRAVSAADSVLLVGEGVLAALHDASKRRVIVRISR